MMPQISLSGQPIVNRYATRAGQLNQSINNQTKSAADLARESFTLQKQILANTLRAAIQAVDPRSARHCDAMGLLLPAARAL